MTDPIDSTPPAATDPAADEATAAPATETRRPRRGLLIGLAAVLIVALAAGAYGVSVYLERKAEEERIAAVQAKAKELDGSIEKAFAEIERLDALWEGLGAGGNPSDMTEEIKRSIEDGRVLLSQLEDVEEAAGTIGDEAISREYSLVAQSMISAVEGASASGADSEDLIALYNATRRANGHMHTADGHTRDSIKACNARRYSDGMKHAQIAYSEFQKAIAAYKEAATYDTSDSSDESLEYAKAAAVRANMEAELARLGKSGAGPSRYNAQIDRIRKQEDKMSNLGGYVIADAQDTASNATYAMARLADGLESARTRWKEVQIKVAAGDF